MIEMIGHGHLECTDAQCVAGILERDRAVMLSFYEKCRRQFFKGTANYKMAIEDREDLFQDSYIVVWEKIENHQIYLDGPQVTALRANGERAAVPDLTGYFMAVVKNKYMELLRRNGNLSAYDPSADTADTMLSLVPDDNPEVMLERIVNHCLISLPASCQEILLKYYHEGFSLAEIAASREQTTSYDGLKTRKSKCMKFLRERVVRQLRDAGLYVPRHLGRRK